MQQQHLIKACSMEPVGGHVGVDGGGRVEGADRAVRAPGVVCRVSADPHCLEHQSDGGTPSETLPGSTKTGTSGT